MNRIFQKPGKQMIARILMSLIGIILSGASIGFFKCAMFGLDPYQCFVNGWANIIPIRFGTLYMIINFLQLVIIFFLDRHYIGIYTFFNLFLLGYIVEISEKILNNIFGNLPFTGRILFLIIGLTVTCLAAAFYYTADLGVSTYDAFPLYWTDRKPCIHGHVLSFRIIRVISDCVCTLTGVILGIDAGIGTILTALCMGPLITFFRQKISDPILARIPT